MTNAVLRTCRGVQHLWHTAHIPTRRVMPFQPGQMYPRHVMRATDMCCNGQIVGQPFFYRFAWGCFFYSFGLDLGAFFFLLVFGLVWGVFLSFWLDLGFSIVLGQKRGMSTKCPKNVEKCLKNV